MTSRVIARKIIIGRPLVTRIRQLSSSSGITKSDKTQQLEVKEAQSDPVSSPNWKDFLFSFANKDSSTKEGALIESIVSLAASGMVQFSSSKNDGSAAMKTEMESRLKHVKEDSMLSVKSMVFKDMIVMNIPTLGFNKKSGMEIKVTSHVLTVAASAITPDGPNALTGSADIPKDIFYDAERVTWDFADGYLRVTFPFGTADTMVQGSFSVKWAPYVESEDGAGSSSRDGTEQVMEHEAGNEKAEDDEHEEKVESKDGDGLKNVDGSGKI